MSEVRPVPPGLQFAAFVGIDWADQKHAWCLQAAGSEERESGELEHTPEAVEARVGQLCQRFASGPIAVAIEQSRGALVFMLSKYEPLHLFPVPSQMSASMRQALYPSGAKDDPRDAQDASGARSFSHVAAFDISPLAVSVGSRGSSAPIHF